MSDNDYSDSEMDTDTSNIPSNNTVNDPKLHARAQHNALERRRRDNIKDMYTLLKEEIPNFNHERASRAQILCKTIEQMMELKHDVELLEDENKKLDEEYEKLQKELEELEAAEDSCRSTPERTLS